jgi:hypothetical protein
MQTAINIDELSRSLAESLAKSVEYQQIVKPSKIDELYQKAHEEDILHLMRMGGYSIYVDFEYEGKTINCLFDTGAQINIMTTNLVSKLGIEDHIDQTIRSQITGAAGFVSMKGFIPYLQLNIGNYSFPTCFDVTDTDAPYECIIGILFMRRYGVCIDFEKNCLHIGKLNIPFRLANK